MLSTLDSPHLPPDSAPVSRIPVLRVTPAGATTSAQLAVADPWGHWPTLLATPSGPPVDLWALAGPRWPVVWQPGGCYSLGPVWAGPVRWTLDTTTPAGDLCSGRWTLATGVPAYWQAEAEPYLAGPGRPARRWRIDLAPALNTPGLARDPVGLRRLALVLSGWLVTDPARGSGLQVALHNRFSARPPAPNADPYLEGWPAASIYDPPPGHAPAVPEWAAAGDSVGRGGGS